MLAKLLATLICLTFVNIAELRSQIPDSIAINNTRFFKVLNGSRQKSHELTWVGQDKFKFHGISLGEKSDYNQELLLSGNHLYLRIDASGILYKSKPLNDTGRILFKRIDKTSHFGYNINSFLFVDSSLIYNIGGYGFWRWNGHLRLFNERIGGWDIVKLNAEIPLSKKSPETFNWKWGMKRRLISLSYIEGNEGIQRENWDSYSRVDTVVELNLTTKRWKNLGRVNSKLSENYSDYIKIASLDSGLLLNGLGKIEYWDFFQNQIYILNNSGKKQQILNKIRESWTWYENGWLYYGNPNLDEIDSLRLRKTDFIGTKQKVFTNYDSVLFSRFFGLVLIVLLFGAAFYLISHNLKFSRWAKNGFDHIETNLDSPHINEDLFTEIEKSLLNLLLINITSKNSKTSTDEVNRVLGVSKSSLNMQKRKRSDVIRSINSKFKLSHVSLTDNLIVRDKSIIDARLQEYFIEESCVETIKKIINFRG